ncbi:uncharacterized protein LOC113322633 [Papaver somniferum]|uniref:uncharacterized protein LOC113322633 n=1 Tax=Papaver somniferum TaxID=3469 RepID=UPI000E6F91B5|nr:uncharacterized protein LOC113322633 [Papaver somniferum]
MYSSDAKSFYTQVLMGVKAGVVLAEKHGISELCVESNSIKLPSLVNLLWDCPSVKCRDGTGICYKGCLGSFFGCRGSDPSLVPLAREIKARAPKGQDLDDLLGYPRGLNKAARYLAKMEKKKAEIQPDIEDEGGMVPPGDEWPAEIQPGDFPEKLKVMLFEQAFGMKYYNDLSGW